MNIYRNGNQEGNNSQNRYFRIKKEKGNQGTALLSKHYDQNNHITSKSNSINHLTQAHPACRKGHFYARKATFLHELRHLRMSCGWKPCA